MTETWCFGTKAPPSFLGQPSVLEADDPKDVARATSLIQTYIPQAFLKDSSGGELVYGLPQDADRACFKGLFQALEQNLHSLHVTGFGISDTTLEEVGSSAPSRPAWCPDAGEATGRP